MVHLYGKNAEYKNIRQERPWPFLSSRITEAVGKCGEVNSLDLETACTSQDLSSSDLND